MLFLVFQLDDDRYAIEAARVICVLPHVDARVVPQAPAGVVGVIDWRGAPVPLVDLAQVLRGRPAHARLSTRIVIVEHPGTDDTTHALGLLAECVVDTLRLDPSAFRDSGIDAGQARYLGPVAADAHGLVQWVRVEDLLPMSVRERLFVAAGTDLSEVAA